MSGLNPKQIGLNLNHIRISNAGRTLIDGLKITILPGQTVTLMGPSGSGKSTLLSYIAGFLPGHFKATGAVVYDGEDLTQQPAEKRRTGLLFQDDLLLPHLNVQQNLMFAIRSHRADGQRRTKAEKHRMITTALNAVDLTAFHLRRPATLSGGQRARIALMRTLLSEPRVLLLDEPFSKLDAGLRQTFRAYVAARIKERELPTLLVTHDYEDARAMNGPVLLLSDDGSVRVKS